jgi:hypothetical protein
MKRYITEDPFRAGVIVVCILAVVGGFVFTNCRKQHDTGLAEVPQQEQIAPAETAQASTEVVATTNTISAKVARDAILSQMGFDTSGGHKVVIQYQDGRGTSNATTKLVQ